MDNFKVSVIIPVFNEAANIPLLTERLIEVLKKYNTYEILYIDDGSIDDTYNVIKDINAINQSVRFVSFSRNFGHQSALKAGLDYADGDCVISMDGDMQHPPALIDKMIDKWKEGYEIVYTIRKDNKSDISFFKSTTSRLFYYLINKLSDMPINEGAADFRLLDEKVVKVIRNEINEYFLFLRGMVSWVGFRQYAIIFTPEKRFAGKTKYSLKKMINFAFNGITSFSTKPLRIAIYSGFIVSFLSFIYAVYAVYMSIYNDKTVAGWTSVIISVLFIGGIQMILIGILGEYLGKLFIENKRRPNYIVKDMSV